MTRSRLRPGYSVSSRSRVVSSVARSGYGNPLIPRSRASSEYYSPISKASSGYYDSAAFDYAMDDTLSRSNYISSAAIDDFYDTSARSRGKDRRLLDETTTAIVSSETHASPRAAVASLRARSRVPVAGSTGPARSSYQVKSTTLSSSSYPTVPQAAIVASKLEMEEPRRRRPRSKFAADKLRSVRLESLETQRELGGPAAPLAKGDKMPMSETRRRLRRVIVRHRNDPHYYRE